MITICQIGPRFAQVFLGMTVCLLSWNIVQAADGGISGRVIDAEGKPVTGAEIARFWSSSKERMTPFHKATTGADGQFSIRVDDFGQGVAVLAFDADQKRGALAVVSSNSFGEPLVMKLGAVVTVRGQFTCTEL